MKVKCLIVFFVFSLLSFCPFAFGLEVSTPAIPVPGWEPTPNSDRQINYISPDADFMLLDVGGSWPNRSIASRTYNSGTSSWSPAVNLSFSPDTVTASLSPNGDMLFYGYNWGTSNTMVSRSKWSGSSWVDPEKIFTIPSWSPMFTGSKLYFNIPGAISGYGDDLAVSDYDPLTDHFLDYSPISELNTEYYENDPRVSSDGKLMLFASDRPGGYGGIDIWSATWNESLQVWGNIANLGPNINTSGNERFANIAENAQLLFFTRDGSLMQATIVPEPATLLLLTLGGLALRRRNRSKN